METFNLPDVGEGLTEAELIEWRVKPGDQIAVNDTIADIETAKSVVELPSPFTGTVGELLVDEGTTVDVGAPILTIDTSGGAPEEQASASEGGATPEPTPDASDSAVLVGYGSGAEAKTRRAPKTHDRVVASSVGVIAKPPVRKLARDVGVTLSDVAGTGPAGEVTREDVMRHAEQASVFRNMSTPEWPAERERRIPAPQKPLDDRYEAIPVKGVRKATASAMVGSAYTAPHVSVWTDVDATRTMEFVARLKKQPQFADVRVSPLLVYAKAVIWAAQRTPEINAAWIDTESGAEIQVRNYVNLGIAAATPRGLLVPNIKDAQKMSIRELAIALQSLTQKARDGKTSPEDQQGGTITITNIGVFGMDAGTPILNPGEAGIVAMGSIRQKPWVVDGEVRPAWVTTVSGSFDHRVVDGDKISRFLADIAAVLEEPALLLD
ncbi:dihydrolipoamide acetyltransferase family protein [Microbacterium amylolyticum]|uniref:Dihydrolipoamide acetyltransferase component of pyruvate dehydrogenase complex n=1 Tax=Microbacterium amylolyticum TaxID=936337 RepID=A0ABS4ZI83_9MICO|nr:dihydrolipoamide acetyltransferase family protein [Microbacterium amylolyticum]MBP2436985.1 pyruvate dehydrogenase E2 component (dihydrolipoamide acetyltransferase) [Microbacterium amylolyticum]